MATALINYGWQTQTPQLTPLISGASNTVYFGTAGSGNDQFFSPSGVVFSPNGARLAVIERSGRRVHMFGINGNTITHQTVFGTLGSGNGQFTAPFYITFSPDGSRLAVSDTNNNRIQVLGIVDNTITHQVSYGAAGAGNEQYAYPRGICFNHDGSRLIVVDTNNNRLQLLGISGNSITHLLYYGIAGSGDGMFSQPHGASFSSDGSRLVVADRGNNRLQVFAVSSDIITHHVSFGTSGSGNGQFNAPGNVVFSPDGSRLGVADTSNNRIQILGIDWNTITHQISYGALGSVSGRLSLPSDIAFSPDGLSLAVADTNNNRIQIL